MRNYDIVVVHGDGIGREVCQAARDVITAIPAVRDSFRFREVSAGAGEYLASGHVFPDASFEACRAADAVLHGSTGLPDVTFPDGTEVGIEFGLQMRFRLDLYANIRPIKLRPGIRSRLRDRTPGDIDYVIVRENTEGLYAARGNGVVLRDEVAVDNLTMTRRGIERIVHTAFRLAEGRNGAVSDGKRRVTCCDKANVLRSYAFFRKVFNEVAEQYPGVERDYAYADAMTCHLVERPEFYDVIVAENMLGDIISDLAAVTVGSMGMSPSAELGDSNGFFQAAHGSAPTIAGQNIANPYGSILSAAAMLDWLGTRHGDARLTAAAVAVDRAVDAAMATPAGLTRDLGGSASTTEIAALVAHNLARAEIAA